MRNSEVNTRKEAVRGAGRQNTGNQVEACIRINALARTRTSSSETQREARQAQAALIELMGAEPEGVTVDKAAHSFVRYHAASNQQLPHWLLIDKAVQTFARLNAGNHPLASRWRNTLADLKAEIGRRMANAQVKA